MNTSQELYNAAVDWALRYASEGEDTPVDEAIRNPKGDMDSATRRLAIAALRFTEESLRRPVQDSENVKTTLHSLERAEEEGEDVF